MTETDEPQLHYLDYEKDFLVKVGILAEKIAACGWMPDFVIGVGRGGLAPAVYLSHELSLPMLSIDHSSRVPGFAEELLEKVALMSREGQRLLIVDDINDSGGTVSYLRERLTASGCDPANLRFAVMINNRSSSAEVDLWADTIDRTHDKRWFVFPWESRGTRRDIIAEAQSVPERLA